MKDIRYKMVDERWKIDDGVLNLIICILILFSI